MGQTACVQIIDIVINKKKTWSGVEGKTKGNIGRKKEKRKERKKNS